MHRTRTITRLGFAALACVPLSVALGEGSELPDGSVTITSLPFFDSGDTSDNLDDYDAVCPWASTSPDVFYTYVPPPDVTGIRVFLCNSQYDTKTYVLDEALNEIACDDDFCDSEGGGSFRSLILCAPVTPGTTYYIAIDGWSGLSGVYDLEVEACVPPVPCIFGLPGKPVCPPDARIEGEPCLPDEPDTINGGCNSSETDPLFTSVICGDTVCGTLFQGSALRDTDWFELTIPIDANVTMFAVGESDNVYGRIHDQDCASGAPECACITGTIDPWESSGPCQDDAVTAPARAGRSWWFISTTVAGVLACDSEVPGNDYIVSWNCDLRPCCTLGDSNEDSVVDFIDLVTLLANWGPCGG